jgi:PAS domain S-box-containing protein
MIRDHASALSWGQRLFLVIFALAVLGLAMLIWLRSQHEIQRNAQITFEAQVDKMAADLGAQFGHLRVVLDGSAAFWETHSNASQTQWKNFVERLAPWEKSDGLNAVAFVQPVLKRDLNAFVALMRGRLANDFSVHGYRPQDHAGELLDDSDDLFVITHFEPYQRHRKQLLGLDVGREKARRAALEKARDSGAMVLTDPVRLVTTASDEADLLAVTPVYRSSFPLLTVKQRRVALQGWVTVGLHGPSLAQGVFSEARGQGYDIGLYTLNAAQEKVMLLAPSSAQNMVPRDEGGWSVFLSAEQTLITTRSLVLGGKTWIIEAGSTPQLERRLQGDRWGSLVVNVALAMALTGGLWLLLISRQQSRLLARQVLAQLDERERHYRSVVEGTAEGFWQIDPLTRRTIEVNSSLCAMLGYEREEILGQSPAYFCHPSSREVLNEQMEAIWTTKHRMYEMTLLRKSGEVLFVHMAATTLRDEHDVVTSVFGMLTDITEVVRMREALTEQARALEASNSDLKQFAYVASHDLQAPLRSVSSYLQLLVRRYGDSLNDEAREFIDFAVSGAHRMAQLINDLLAFSRLETRAGRLKPVDVGRCLEQALKNLEVNIASVQGHVEVPAALPVILGEQGQLVSLFQNLIGNALKYCPAERKPRVQISAHEHRDTVEILVADNGIGIPVDQYERIFLIFQRLHGPEQYEGTGIGLALCKRIIDQHGGTISVEANHDETGAELGTIFRVKLPIPRREMES